MTELKPPIPKQPMRLSERENIAPTNYLSIAIKAFVVIIAMGIALVIGMSVLVVVLTGVLIALGFIAYSFVTEFLNRNKKPVTSAPLEEVPPEKKPISSVSALTPFIDEAVSEWHWLMKVLRIYDNDAEAKRLSEYRKLRGWK